MDRAWVNSLLHLLPSFVYRVFVQIHGQAQRLRLDHLLEQHRCLGIAAHALPALRFDLSREKTVRPPATLATCIGVPARSGDPSTAYRRLPARPTQRTPHVGYGSAGNGVRRTA